MDYLRCHYAAFAQRAIVNTVQSTTRSKAGARATRSGERNPHRLSAGIWKESANQPETMDGNVMTTKRLQTTSEAHAHSPEIKSSLVRRLVQAKDDPAKRRIRAWLNEIDDERLLAFGLTHEEIRICRQDGSKP